MPLSHPPVSADDDTTAAGVREDMAGANATTRRRWVPLVLPPLVGMFALGLSYLYWQGEEDNVQAKNALNFEVAADQIASTRPRATPSCGRCRSGIPTGGQR